MMGEKSRGDTSVLPEARGVDIGARKKLSWEVEDNKCRCGNKVGSADRYCTNCGRLLLRGGKPLPAGETPKRISTPTELFVSKGAVEIHDEGGGAEENPARPDWEAVEGGEDPAVRMDAGAVRAALKKGVLIRKKKGPPLE